MEASSSTHRPAYESGWEPTDEQKDVLRRLLKRLKAEGNIKATSEEELQTVLADIQAKAKELAVQANLAVPKATPKSVGDGDHINGKWQNWGKSINPRSLAKQDMRHPETVQEVQSFVREAVNDKKRVRCVGHGHTWTPVFFDGPDDSTRVLFMDKLKLYSGQSIEIVRAADVSAKRPARVRVAAGVTTGELATFFEAYNEELGEVGLPSDVILNTVRYGGVISMACHGTGRSVRTVPDFVVALTLVDHTGAVLKLDKGNCPYWNEVRASFGLMGVLVDITFELDADLDKPYVRVEHTFDSMRNALPDANAMKSLAEGSDGVELFWFPLNSASLLPSWLKSWDPVLDDMWIINFTRVPADAHEVPARYEDKPGQREELETELGADLNWLSQTRKSLWLQALYGKFGVICLKAENTLDCGWLKNGVKTLPTAIHYQRSIDEFRVFDFEMCFPVEDDFSNAFNAWYEVVKIASETIRQDKANPLNVALECRFTKGSLATMSPAHVKSEESTQLFCWMEVLCGVYTPPDLWLNFVTKVFTAWSIILGPTAKIHWAKWNDLAESGRNGVDILLEHQKRVFEDQISVFREKVLEVDPKGVFRNDWLSRIFDITYSD